MRVVQVPVEVLKVGDDKLQVSALALAVAGVASPEPALGAEALKDLVPFQPTTTRTFESRDTLRLFARLFWGRKDLAAAVIIKIQGSAIAPRAMSLSATAASRGYQQAMLDTTVPLTGLASGDYTLVVEARLPSGDTASRLAPLGIR